MMGVNRAVLLFRKFSQFFTNFPKIIYLASSDPGGDNLAEFKEIRPIKISSVIP